MSAQVLTAKKMLVTQLAKANLLQVSLFVFVLLRSVSNKLIILKRGYSLD